ncbi:hypothetical protein GT348_05850 [Aristophania vespae]|uniref:NADH:quinone oxidoreductase/Mrp antiporter membrane subunit domain-containing protein n=1 Tax=Aristophania vespae TaxID=2697033 RepID=A0A6P1NLU0_9PROT|nr:hypothetical protein [Aristophania vespae]QHI95831.1 hypothetical protein GT348_05850 [Aristophania vespae]
MSSLSAVLLPSVGLFAVLCWPFLVAWLLWVSRRTGHVKNLAAVGAIFTIGALVLFPSRLDLLAIMSIGVASCLPLLLFWLPQTELSGAAISTPKGERLPFLIIGCVLMALCLSSALAICVFIGAGCVILAWWDGQSTRRALAAWSMVRLRLCGVILGILGAALLHEVPNAHAEVTGEILGLVFLIIGLGMMAGLGSSSNQTASFVLLDIALRFAALTLMLRLGYYPFARDMMLLAGAIGSVISALFRRREDAFLLFVTSLASFAAAIQSPLAFLLLMIAALLGMGIKWHYQSLKINSFDLPEWCVIPIFFVALMIIGRDLSPFYLGVMLLSVLLSCRNIDFIKGVQHHFVSCLSLDYFTKIMLFLIGFTTIMGACLMPYSFSVGWHP